MEVVAEAVVVVDNVMRAAVGVTAVYGGRSCSEGGGERLSWRWWWSTRREQWLASPPFAVVVVVVVAVGFTTIRNGSSRGCGGRCHAPNTFGTVNMECTVDSRLSWSKR